jgi:SAM-dependent methyltransferase
MTGGSVAGTDEWMTIAQAADADDIRERILTGYKDGKPFTPYIPTVALPRHIKTVLDFGCGLGRNFPYLSSVAQTVTGFDLPPMIERCRAVTPVAIELTSDWPSLASRRFDLVFASLVLQHIEPNACAAFLQDFARMSDTIYVITRADSDFDTNVIDDIAALDLFDAPTWIEVEHDDATDQLRVVGRVSEEQARTRRSGHYEAMLRVRRKEVGGRR